MLSLVVAETERAITTVPTDAILRHRTDAMWLFVLVCGDRASKEKKASVQYRFWDKRTTKMRTRPPWTLSALYLLACQVIVIVAAALCCCVYYYTSDVNRVTLTAFSVR